MAPGEKDEDDISITSTAPSEQLEEYEVQGILAQRTEEGREEYLVRWAGYPLERSTWEPEDAFFDPQILVNWRKRQEAIARKEKPPFNLQAFTQIIDDINKATRERKRRRRAKRIRLGILDSSSKPGEFDDASSGPDDFVPAQEDSGDDTSSSDTPIILLRNKALLSIDTSNIKSKTNPVAKDIQSANASTKAKHSTQQTVDPGSATAGKNANSSKPLANISPAKRPGQTAVNQTSQPCGSSENLSQNVRRPPGEYMAKKAGEKQQKHYNTSELGPSSAGGMFRNISTQRRHQKASCRERTPDISQLDIRKPGEWLEAGQKTTGYRSSTLSTHQNQNDDSLFVEQDNSAEDYPRSPQQNSPRYSDMSSLDRHLKEFDNERTNDKRAPQDPERSLAPGLANGRFQSTKPIHRSWQPGEVRVDLTCSPTNIEIGDVRFCGLNMKTKRLLIDLSVNYQVPINIREVCNVEQYRELCKRIHNRAYGHGWISGNENTEPSLNELASYLRGHRLVALWHYPSTTNPSTFVVYAAGTGQWSFLDGGANFSPSAQLRIAVRSPLDSAPSTNSLIPRPITEPVRSDVQAPPRLSASYATQSPIKQSPFIQSPTIQSPVIQSRPILPPAIQSPVAVSPVTHLPSLERSESADIPPSHLPGQNSKSLPDITSDFDVITYFHKHYNITFEELTVINRHSNKTNTAHAFYLHFPEEVEHEYQLVRRFLKRYTKAIFSNRHPDDWDRFVEMASVGTVLFHQRYIFYDQMRHLHRLLRGPINIFNISLAEPINWADYECHTQRLFPHGGVILLTEDFIIHEAQAALKVVQWFAYLVDTKFPGTWKMYLRPNVLQWLRNLWPQWHNETMYHLFCWIESLIPDQLLQYENSDDDDSDSGLSFDGEVDDEGKHQPFISPRFLPDYGSRTEDAHENIPKGLSQEERNADHLIENFAGWAMMNCDKYRRFIALTHCKLQPRWDQWYHMRAMNFDEFNQKILEPEYNFTAWKRWWVSINSSGEENQSPLKIAESEADKDKDGDIVMK